MFDWIKKPQKPTRPQIDSVSECFTQTDPKDPAAAILHVMKCETSQKGHGTFMAHFMIDGRRAISTKGYAYRSGFPPEQFLAMIVDGEMHLHAERLNRII